MKPWQQASRQVARTQPLVVRPVMISVSMPHVVERRRKRGAEEGARILLGHDEFVVTHVKTCGPGAHRAAFEEMPQRLGLLIEAATVQRVLLVDDVGVDHRHAVSRAASRTRIAEASAASTPA